MARPRRILIDCTETYYSGLGTGIQRVVRAVVEYAAAHRTFAGIELLPFVVHRDGAVRAVAGLPRPAPGASSALRRGFRAFARWAGEDSWLLNAARRARGAVRGFRYAAGAWRGAAGLPGAGAAPGMLTAGPDDLVLAVDAAFGPDGVRLLDALERPELARAAVVGVVYDLFPLQFPETTVAARRKVFGQCLQRLARRADGLAAISESTMEALADYLREHQPERAGMTLKWFHLGADLKAGASGEPVIGAAVREALRTGPVYLAVGSVEPRKNYGVILDAFETLWREGRRLPLCIVGRDGWMNKAEVARINNSRQRGSLLHWLRSVSDEELAALYAGSRALVQASIAEGFGLPVVEAMSQGLSVIASDIPVFREIAGDYPIYFAPRSPAELLGAVLRLERKLAEGWRPEPRPWQTWEQAVEQLLAACVDIFSRRQGEYGAADSPTGLK